MMIWMIPPSNQGQHVEVSYGSDGNYLYRRVVDRSDGEEVIDRVHWDAWGYPGRPWDPVNTEPDWPVGLSVRVFPK